jgi:hypothetical protein
MRTCTLLMIAAMTLASCKAPDTRSEQMRRWLSESGTGCVATASMLKKLRLGVATFERIYAEELEKTKANQRPFQRYNPKFLTRLEGGLAALDIAQGPLAQQLARDVWPSHYRFVKRAPERLPRLHRFLVLLAQLQSTIRVARALERRYGKTLTLMSTTGKKLQPPKAPFYGVLIKSPRSAVFQGNIPPQAKPRGKTAKCAPSVNTLRVLSTTDPELTNRVRCRGKDKIVFTAHLYHLVQIQLLLAKIKKLDPRGLAIAFRRSAE